MKNKFLKIVVISFTTLALLFTFINANATQLEDYSPTNGAQTLPLKTWEDIKEPNDLLGVTLLFNDIIRPVGLANDYDDSSYLQISYNFNFEEYELESRPYLWGTGTDGIQVKQVIGRGMILRLQEEHSGDDPLSIFSGAYDPLNNSGLLFNLYDPDYEYNLIDFEYHNQWKYGPRLISFPYDQRDPESVQLEIIVTGSNWDTNFSSPWQALYAFLVRNTTIVYSSSMASDLLTLDQIASYNQGYNDGYNQGYNDGYQDGELNAGNDGYRFTFLTGIFNGVSDLLAIEIFPNVQLGYFVFIPLALGITGMILWFWRKD